MPEGKRIVSFNSRIFNKSEQKMSTLLRELCGIVSALQTYEHFIIGSPHPVLVYCDHKPILCLCARTWKLFHRFFRYQLIIAQFQNSKIFWTPGKNLAFPDILSRDITLEERNRQHLRHKHLPKDIKFYDPNGNEIRSFTHHDNRTYGEANNFYPILCHQNDETTTLHLKNDGTEVFTERYCTTRVNSITDMKENFLQGKHINQYRKISSDDVEDSDFSHYYQHLDLTETSDQSEQIEHTYTDELACDQMDAPSDIDVDLINQIHETKNGQTEPSQEECNILEKTEHKNKTNFDLLKISTARLEAEADFNIIAILEEQRKDPVLKAVRIWVREKLKPEKSQKSDKVKHFWPTTISLKTSSFTLELKFYASTKNHGTDAMGTQTCVPLSLILSLLNLAHNYQLAGHMRKDKTLYNLKRFVFWPDCYKWVSSLIADSFNCQKNKSKRHDLNSAPLEKWGETVCIPLHTVDIDHKGPLNPPSKKKTLSYCC